jgi:signal transduction histidine kinase/ligand-binding sensor domain-containing protein
MKLFLGHCIVVFLFFFAKDIAAQTHPVKFNLVSGTNGISLGKINGITRDMNGVMWFSDQTNRCITRYDGNHITRYQNDPKNINSLGGTYPECLFADSSGIIWIGFYGMGVDRFDPETNNFTHFRHQQNDAGSLSNDTVSAILVDHLGNLWVGNNGGLDLLDQKTGKFKHYRNNVSDSTSLSYNKVRAIYEDHEGTIWIGTGFVWDFNNDGGLNRFNRNNGTFTRYLNDPKNPHSLIKNVVRAIFEDSRGTFWVGTTGDGLHTMDRKTGLFERHTYNPAKPEQLSRPPLKTNDDHITFITEDATGNLWIGTLSNGLVRYDPITKKTDHFGANADISGGFKENSGWWANSSRDGLFWVSTQQANLYRIDLFTNNIPHYEINNVLGVNTFYEETPSVFWYGTDSGLVRKDSKNGAIHRFRNEPLNANSLSNNTVGAILKEKQGSFWLGTRGGMNRFNPNTGIFTHFQHDPNNIESLSNDNIIVLYEDGESNLWIGTLGGGLDLMNRKTGKFTHYINIPNDTNSLTQNFVTGILEDETKDIWIGTWNNGGINRMNRQTGKFKHYLPDVSVTCIYRDFAGIIWVGAENGLYWYNRKSDDFSFMTEKNVGVNINSVRSIISDDQNNLWVASSSGIYRINQKKDQIIFYGKENGINTEYIYYGAAYKAMDGKLFFGDYSGYYSFYPDKLKISSGVPKIDLTNFWITGQAIKPTHNGPWQETLSTTKEIHLRHNQNVFSLSFTAIDYGNPENKRIYYKLEGYDKEWHQYGTEDRVYYFNVPPGKYIFQIKAANTNNGIWAEKDISITITPPWWNRWWAYCIYGLLFIVLAFSIHRFQKVRLLKAERERTRVKELAQAREIEKAYRELKTTQSQLIQQEKMASLGELTAGIAHEIQNPLNFINNFSEVNTELIDEMKEELKSGNADEALKVAEDIKENNKKITHHGKRADGIVKGMLQHSRSSSGVKEPTDINALADEYLRLSYHGLRAKDKSFNATMKTDFDENIGTINLISQDIGRVILNLFTNAFYAVSEKKKHEANGYEPTVSISTKKMNGKVEVRVKDNGNGIPQKVMDKIFQPFFTTKPTGQGTGLGLSLSYDIIKAHGGELKVETKEGEGAEFIIILPS